MENAKKFAPGMVTKSGVMVGLGETSEELVEVFRMIEEEHRESGRPMPRDTTEIVHA